MKLVSNALITMLNFQSKYGEVVSEPYKDGGTVLYKGLTYNVLVCNSLAEKNNKDIYFGSIDLKYEESYCH